MNTTMPIISRYNSPFATAPAPPDGCLVERHESEPVPGRHSYPDRAKRWQVAGGIDIHGLKLTDLLTRRVYHVVAPALSDIASFEHAAWPP
jgi:hypothetical protein